MSAPENAPPEEESPTPPDTAEPPAEEDPNTTDGTEPTEASPPEEKEADAAQDTLSLAPSDEEEHALDDDVPKKHHSFRWFIVLVVVFFVVGIILERTVAPGLLEDLKSVRSTGALIALGALYAFLLAIPGMPGIEIGLFIMFVFGEAGIIACYVCTVIGLNAGFGFGRYWKSRDPGNDAEVLFKQRMRKSKRAWIRGLVPRFERNRYLTIGFLLNMPGNWILGGGGGIGLLCGSSERFKWRNYFLMTLIAAVPPPLVVYLGLFSLGGMFD